MDGTYVGAGVGPGLGNGVGMGDGRGLGRGDGTGVGRGLGPGVTINSVGAGVGAAGQANVVGITGQLQSHVAHCKPVGPDVQIS